METNKFHIDFFYHLILEDLTSIYLDNVRKKQVLRIFKPIIIVTYKRIR